MNRVVGPAFGLRFEAESFRRWARKGGSGALTPVLEELGQIEPPSSPSSGPSPST